MKKSIAGERRIIKPGYTSPSEYFRKVWQYRTFIFVLAEQDLKVQYAQTALGILWVILRPLMVLSIFTFIFGRLIHNMEIPYPLFALSGLLAWNYFSYLVSNGGNAVISNQNLIRKIYFPKLIFVIAKAVVGLVELGVTVLLMLALMALLHYPLTFNVLWLPVCVLLNMLIGFTIAVWLNAMSVRFRDINQFVPQLIGFVIWLTPVFYPVTLIPHNYTFLLYFNPLAGVLESYRFALLAQPLPSWLYLITLLGVIVIQCAGLLIFIRVEDQMPDYL